jgi:voltage-dependent calcium channel L type alpha-1F
MFALLFFVLVIALCATVGMQLFGGRFYFLATDEPSATFDTFVEAFLTIFQVHNSK